MLARANRVRASKDFSYTVRSGARTGRRNLVLYAVATSEDLPSRFGMIVSKNVGNAVTRNLVKRRLREIAADALKRHPSGLTVVVRALPASSRASWNGLSVDFKQALSVSVERSRKVGQRNGKGGSA